ncbi:MAG: hypothetical protein K0B81_09240 [Candidatus Cloacimonetes bacterium]|nr:hypothetical protein [Candidatus Cloacimonadota bacterium]
MLLIIVILSVLLRASCFNWQQNVSKEKRVASPLEVEQDLEHRLKM